MYQPRTGSAGRLARETGLGAAGHVGPGQPQPWEQLIEPNSLHLQESHSSPALLALNALWERARGRGRGRVEHFISGAQFPTMPYGT